MGRELFIFLFLIHAFCGAQVNESRRRFFIPLQMAGSIGLFSAGAGSTFAKEKLDVSLMYGYLPSGSGGPVHTATIKFGYTPWRFHVNQRLSIAPFSAGCFFAQHFNRSLGTGWDEQYPKGYYWWPRNFRQHVFLRTTLELHTNVKKLEKLNFYLEMNTNDLYLYSYLPNTRAMSFYDILFFGLGVHFFLR